MRGNCWGFSDSPKYGATGYLKPLSSLYGKHLDMLRKKSSSKQAFWRNIKKWVFSITWNGGAVLERGLDDFFGFKDHFFLHRAEDKLANHPPRDMGGPTCEGLTIGLENQ